MFAKKKMHLRNQPQSAVANPQTTIKQKKENIYMNKMESLQTYIALPERIVQVKVVGVDGYNGTEIQVGHKAHPRQRVVDAVVNYACSRYTNMIHVDYLRKTNQKVIVLIIT